METMRRILRNAFGTVTAIYLVAWVFLIANMDKDFGKLNTTLEYLATYAFLAIHIPAFLVLIILSIYGYLSKGTFWSDYGKEYNFLFISLIPFVVALMSVVAIP